MTAALRAAECGAWKDRRRFTQGQVLFNADPPVGLAMMSSPFRLIRTLGLSRPKASDTRRWQVSWLTDRRRRPAFPIANSVAVEAFR